jgi:general stress protein 26
MKMNEMDQMNNLQKRDAINKIKALTKAAHICMFTTSLSHQPLSTRPMGTQDTDDDGNIWFFSAGDSKKNEEIAANPKVQLFYSNPGSAEFLTVYGNAIILRDKEKIAQFWNPIAKAWFKEGKEDPNITLIKVSPEEAHYWDTKSNKMVSLLKIFTSVVTGVTMDNGVEGSLAV